jgi:hypothetical protein
MPFFVQENIGAEKKDEPAVKKGVEYDYTSFNVNPHAVVGSPAGKPGQYGNSDQVPGHAQIERECMPERKPDCYRFVRIPFGCKPQYKPYSENGKEQKPEQKQAQWKGQETQHGRKVHDNLTILK